MAEAAWKPWAAGLLVAAALAMLGRNLIIPLVHGNEPGAPPVEPAIPTVPAQPSTASQIPSEARIDDTGNSATPGAGSDSSELSEWITEIDRDPFGSRPRRRQATTDSDNKQPHSPWKPGRAGEWKSHSRVSAMVWGQGRMALVDGIAVGVGDSVAQGRVQDIGFYGVLVRRAGSDTILRFPEGRKP